MLKKTIKFILYTYLISWFFWVILAFLSIYKGYEFGEPRFMVLFSLGGLGPFFSVFILKNPVRNNQEFKTFFAQIIKWAVNPLWYLWIFFIPFFLFLIPWIINYLANGSTIPIFRQEVFLILSLIPMNILYGGLEEVGWRGILLPELMKKYSIILSTVITSIIWSLWHIPLWFIKSSPQENMNILFFIILGLSFSFLLTVVYTKTKSIFLCILLHSIFNTYPNIMNLPISSLYRDSLIMLAFAVITFMVFEKVDLSNFVYNNKKIS